jgi:hypothetical protein
MQPPFRGWRLVFLLCMFSYQNGPSSHPPSRHTTCRYSIHTASLNSPLLSRFPQKDCRVIGDWDNMETREVVDTISPCPPPPRPPFVVLLEADFQEARYTIGPLHTTRPASTMYIFIYGLYSSSCHKILVIDCLFMLFFM